MGAHEGQEREAAQGPHTLPGPYSLAALAAPCSLGSLPAPQSGQGRNQDSACVQDQGLRLADAATRSRLHPWGLTAGPAFSQSPARGSPHAPPPGPTHATTPLRRRGHRHSAQAASCPPTPLPQLPGSCPEPRGWRLAARGLPDGCNPMSAGLRHLPSLFPPSPPPAQAFLHISACKGLPLLSHSLGLLLWGGQHCLHTPSWATLHHSQAQTGPKGQAHCCPCVQLRTVPTDNSGTFSGHV